jgi:hypothetical protein
MNLVEYTVRQSFDNIKRSDKQVLQQMLQDAHRQVLDEVQARGAEPTGSVMVVVRVEQWVEGGE